MGELVDDHIIDHFKRGKHQSPGETEASFRVAGAPARACRRDANFLKAESILKGIMCNPLREHLQGLLLVPEDEKPSGSGRGGQLHPEPGIGEDKPLLLNCDQAERIFVSQVKEGFPINELLPREGRGSLYLGLFLLDPPGMAAHKFQDLFIRHAKGGTHREAAIPLNDQRDRPAPGMDEMVDGDRHDQKYTKSIVYRTR